MVFRLASAAAVWQSFGPHAITMPGETAASGRPEASSAKENNALLRSMLARLQGSRRASPPAGKSQAKQQERSGSSVSGPAKTAAKTPSENAGRSPSRPSSEALDNAFLEGLRRLGGETLLGGLYAGLAEKRGATDAQLRRTATAQDKALEAAIVEAAHALARGGTKHLTVMLPWFGHWLRGYVAFVASVRAAGYEFRTLEALRDGPQKRSIFMRYDIHLRDLPPALGFVEANRLLGVEAEFHLPLGYSRQYAAAEADFDMLTAWLSTVSKPAFHAAPFESHLIWTYFAGDEFAFTRWTRTPEAMAFVTDLVAGRATPYGTRDALMAKAEAGFLAHSAKFKAIFPQAVSCSGHGGALNGRLSGLKASDASAASLHALMGSREFITKERAEKAGFIGESHEASVRFGMDYVSDLPDGPFTAELQAAIDAGRSAILVIHPALVQRGHYAFEPLRAREAT